MITHYLDSQYHFYSHYCAQVTQFCSRQVLVVVARVSPSSHCSVCQLISLGMRIVHDEKDLVASIQSARREAHDNFGSDRLLIEVSLSHSPPSSHFPAHLL